MECVYTYCHGCSSGSEEKELTVSVGGGESEAVFGSVDIVEGVFGGWWKAYQLRKCRVVGACVVGYTIKYTHDI